MSNTEFPKMAISFNFIFGFQIVDVTVKGDKSFEVEIYILVHNPLLVRRKQSTKTTAYMYQKKTPPNDEEILKITIFYTKGKEK